MVSPVRAVALEGAEILLRYCLFLLLIGTRRFKSVMSIFLGVYTLPLYETKNSKSAGMSSVLSSLEQAQLTDNLIE